MKTNIWTKFNKMKKTLSNYLTCLLTGPPECVDFSDFILFMDIVLNSPSDGQWGNVSRVARRNFKKAGSVNLSRIRCNLVNFFIFAIFFFCCWNLECFMPVKIWIFCQAYFIRLTFTSKILVWKCPSACLFMYLSIYVCIMYIMYLYIYVYI